MGKSRKEMIRTRRSTREEWIELVKNYADPWMWLERKGMEMEEEHGERKTKESRYGKEQIRML